MKDTRKEAAHNESGKSSISKAEYGSLLIASLKFNKKSIRLSQSKKDKPKSESHLKAVGTKMMKRKVSDTSSRKRTSSRKVISRKILQKALDKKSSKKLASSEPQDKHSSAKRSKKKSKRGKKEKVELDEPARLQRRTRYLLIKMKNEQNFIDAYSGEGWKGQSREKIKPEKELLRARKQILNCKVGIREVICQLDSLSKVGCIEDSVIAPDGSVSHEYIFCAKCKSNEVHQDNDIILCDGTCNCGFHQKCLDPPLDTENIPPGDEGWYCKYCECRMDIIEAMNAHLGTQFQVSCCWQDIFKEVAIPDDGHTLLNPEEEWPSDDSKDDDYDPQVRENGNISGAGTDDDANGSTSSGWSSDGDVFSGSRKWEMNTEFGNQPIYSSNLASDESSDGEIMYGRRQRRAVDYRKLHDEMFGKDAAAHEQFSDDEEWGPAAKRKRRVKESDAATTLITLYQSHKRSKKVESSEVKRKLSHDPQVRRSFFRIPPSAVEKLKEVFAENELPSRTVKENLSRELCLEPGKVSKWFKNARYLALKSRKADGAKEFQSSSPLVSTSRRLEAMESRTAVLEEIKPILFENKTHNPKDLKQLRRRKNLKSVRRNEMKNSSIESLSESNKINFEDNNDVSLKKLLKSKNKRGIKMVESVSTTESRVAEAEIERLCRAKDRLENVKKTLLAIQNYKAKKSNRNHLHQESVVFVPSAELREKF